MLPRYKFVHSSISGVPMQLVYVINQLWNLCTMELVYAIMYD